MKLSMSQIAWQPSEDAAAMRILQKNGMHAVEIAPTRVAGENPYQNLQAAKIFAHDIMAEHGLVVCSMQSIWFGQVGNMFGPQRAALLQYTKDAMFFARQLGAKNLVFGSPKNRNLPQGASPDIAIDFFKELAACAKDNGTVLSLEANPAVYGTNFMNTTEQAHAMQQKVDSPACKVNLDFGTILINEEDVNFVQNKIKDIGHVHISEPELAMIEKRNEHRQLASVLRAENYQGYVSVEMKQQSLYNIEKAAEYLLEVFG